MLNVIVLRLYWLFQPSSLCDGTFKVTPKTMCAYGGVCLCVWMPGVHSWMCWRFCASETGLYKAAARSGTASSFGSSSQTSRLLQVIYHLRLSASEQQHKASGEARLHLNVNTESSDWFQLGFYELHLCLFLLIIQIHIVYIIIHLQSTSGRGGQFWPTFTHA